MAKIMFSTAKQEHPEQLHQRITLQKILLTNQHISKKTISISASTTKKSSSPMTRIKKSIQL